MDPFRDQQVLSYLVPWGHMVGQGYCPKSFDPWLGNLRNLASKRKAQYDKMKWMQWQLDISDNYLIWYPMYLIWYVKASLKYKDMAGVFVSLRRALLHLLAYAHGWSIVSSSLDRSYTCWLTSWNFVSYGTAFCLGGLWWICTQVNIFCNDDCNILLRKPMEEQLQNGNQKILSPLSVLDATC